MRQRAIIGALLLIGVGVVLGATVFRTDIAQATGLAQSVTVNNTPSQAVPVREQNLDGGSIKVREQGTVRVTPPLWQGTPYVDTNVVFGSGCEAFKEVPAGKVLYVQHAIASFNVAPGQGGTAAVGVTPLGGSEDFIYLPTHPSGPVDQVSGVYDGYMGSDDIGLPTSTAPEACFFASAEDDLRGRIIVSGYLVDAS
jgi:hypothetical protein